MKIVLASDSSLLVVFGNEISPAIHAEVIALFHALVAQGDTAIRDLRPAYASLLVVFDPLRLSHDELSARIRQMADSPVKPEKAKREPLSIPVCYDAELGPDLGRVAAKTGNSPEEVVRLHTSAEYRVYFLGFAPGFAYMGGLPGKLYVPRLATPRIGVAAGSVGIAGCQTGIYPADSPGGWQLIGRTPWRMFDPEAAVPARLEPGDTVTFVAINRAEFDRCDGIETRI